MSGLRAPRAGSLRDAQNKLDASFDPEDSMKILNWIGEVTGNTLTPRFDVAHAEKVDFMDHFHSTLKDGVLLCYLVKQLVPDASIPNSSFNVPNNEAFKSAKERERIEIFLREIQKVGVAEQHLFQTDCLFERTNLPKVVSCIRAFGMEIESKDTFRGTKFWPRKSEANPRFFSESMLRAGDNVISLQYGTNKGASQAGMNFGKKRMILQTE
ncbi:hypothetical protein ACOMHN_023583 [Nucella lapillus]